jgi:multidrug efflux system outer membrane protein
MRTSRWTGCVLALVAAASAGCTLGPEPARPASAADEAASYVHESADPPMPSTGGLWWQRFGDRATTELVRMALQHNTDLHVAAARVLESQALLRAAGGVRLPQVGSGLSVNRQRNSFVLPEIGRISPESTTWGADLDISWQADLFGKLKRTRQSAWASLLAEKAGRDAVLHTVVASVVRTRVLVATTQRALTIARDIRTSWESTANTVERRYLSGLVGPVDLYLARENLASARAAEVALEGQVETAMNALDVLVGRRPGTGVELPDTLPRLPDLDRVPTGLPAELLDRRPDLRQSELRLAASTYGIGVALADLYPSLSLTASGGYRSDTLETLVSSDTVIYNAVASLIAPIFTGGQRRAGVDAARARAEQAAASYAGAVLRALREVEDALVLEQSIREQLVHTEQRVRDARAADRLARDRYQRGVETLLRVLETERRVRLAEESWITTQASLWNARIGLFLSLGGDWDPAGAEWEPVAASAHAVASTGPDTSPSNTESGIRSSQ